MERTEKVKKKLKKRLTKSKMRDILSWLTFSNACVAQLVEQRIRNAQVAGSSPAASSTKPRHFRRNDGVFVTFLGT